MKKLLLLSLSFVLLFTLSCTAHASLAEFNDSYLDTSLVQPRKLSTSINLEAGGEQSWGGPYYINNENITLKISSCTWSPPSQEIFIGYLNTSTNIAYGKTYSHGEITGQALSTEGVPNGEYKLYIKNKGTKSITGAINYSVQDNT